MNNVNLIGRLTKDIEVKYTSGNDPKAVARFNLAVRRDEDHTDFIPCIAFGRLAENLEKFCSKGNQIGVTGRITTGKYEKEGKTMYTFDVTASNVEFLTPKAEKNDAQKHDDPVPPNFTSLDEDIPF